MGDVCGEDEGNENNKRNSFYIITFYLRLIRFHCLVVLDMVKIRRVGERK
jgi:hypothetical protein